MEEDEEGTLTCLMQLWEKLVEPEVARHGGWLVKRAGDCVIAAFTGADEAIACATAIQASPVKQVMPAWPKYPLSVYPD